MGTEAGTAGPSDDQVQRLRSYLGERSALVDGALRQYLPQPERWPAKLHEAMCWSLFGGGKRLRPVLTLAAFEAVGGTEDLPYDAVLPAACAIEMVHTYSLIHDDLPAMDDDEERRGRPTCHIKFGEGMALLAGDALLTEAFRVVLDPANYCGHIDAETIVTVALRLSEAAGMRGMVGGQSLDLGFEGPIPDETTLTFLHRRKTGELFRFALFAGATLGGGNPQQVQALSEYGESLGLSFQVADDLLDASQDRGAPAAGLDATPSFPQLLGEAASRERALQLEQRAHEQLQSLGEHGDILALLASFAVHRDH